MKFGSVKEKLFVYVKTLVVLGLFSSYSSAADFSKHSNIIQNIPNAALLLIDSNPKKSISIRPEQLLVPASTLKIVTAYLAIKRWGLEHKFLHGFLLRQRHFMD